MSHIKFNIYGPFDFYDQYNFSGFFAIAFI